VGFKIITLVRSLLDVKQSQGPNHSNVLICQKVILVKSKPITDRRAIYSCNSNFAYTRTLYIIIYRTSVVTVSIVINAIDVEINDKNDCFV
jgi:hypothetical protein